VLENSYLVQEQNIQNLDFAADTGFLWLSLAQPEKNYKKI
jgi:hypothetical protein